MKSSNMIFTIGYPIGELLNEGEVSYLIEINSGIYELNTIEAIVWRLVFNGVISVDSMIEHLKTYKISESQINVALTNLLEIKAVKIFDYEQLMNQFVEFKKLNIVRQGIGMMQVNDEGTIKLGNELVNVTKEEYDIWITIGKGCYLAELVDIIANVSDANSEQATYYVLQKIFSLAHKQVVMIIGG